jgi:hypothetical protein
LAPVIASGEDVIKITGYQKELGSWGTLFSEFKILGNLVASEPRRFVDSEVIRNLDVWDAHYDFQVSRFSY